MTLQTIDKPVEIISNALGHKSVATTKHYLESFSSTRMAQETDINLAAIASKLNKKKKSSAKKQNQKKSRKP
jgi:predicted metal-dependent hydrolase